MRGGSIRALYLQCRTGVRVERFRLWVLGFGFWGFWVEFLVLGFGFWVSCFVFWVLDFMF